MHIMSMTLVRVGPVLSKSPKESKNVYESLAKRKSVGVQVGLASPLACSAIYNGTCCIGRTIGSICSGTEQRNPFKAIYSNGTSQGQFLVPSSFTTSLVLSRLFLLQLLHRQGMVWADWLAVFLFLLQQRPEQLLVLLPQFGMKKRWYCIQVKLPAL